MKANRVYQMAGLPLEQVELHWEELDDALTRYYMARDLADVNIEGELMFPPELTKADKSTYAHLLTGYVNDDGIIEFMHSVSGLPRSLCATWNYLDNVEIDKQGGQPDWATDDCYAATLDVVKAEGALA